MHAAEDGVVLTFFIGSYYVFSNGLTAWIFDPHIGIIVAVLILVVGFILRKIRIKKELRKL
jgi:divalent metal cation (Fe/Co/Zn/Cd) transporter